MQGICDKNAVNTLFAFCCFLCIAEICFCRLRRSIALSHFIDDKMKLILYDISDFLFLISYFYLCAVYVSMQTYMNNNDRREREKKRIIAKFMIQRPGISYKSIRLYVIVICEQFKCRCKTVWDWNEPVHKIRNEKAIKTPMWYGSATVETIPIYLSLLLSYIFFQYLPAFFDVIISFYL